MTASSPGNCGDSYEASASSIIFKFYYNLIRANYNSSDGDNKLMTRVVGVATIAMMVTVVTIAGATNSLMRERQE